MSALEQRLFMSIPSAAVKQDVQARIADVVVASAMKAMVNALGSGPLPHTPKSDPPIATGLTDTVNKLKAIIASSHLVTRKKYQQVASLLDDPPLVTQIN